MRNEKGAEIDTFCNGHMRTFASARATVVFPQPATPMTITSDAIVTTTPTTG
jgi:hypothetical protein